MPDIGFIELLLIGVVGFLVLGPERLPGFFAQIAGVVRQGRQWISDLKRQFEAEKRQLSQPVEEAVVEVRAELEDKR